MNAVRTALKIDDLDDLDDLVALVTATEFDAGDERALTLVLADFLACVEASFESEKSTGARFGDTASGLDEVVSELAVRSCLGDRDDIDWRGTVHPGSIVWPVALALASDLDADGPTLLAAAVAGYRATTALAQLLGSAHAARYHPTGVAGAFGAAVTAGTLLRLEHDELVAASAHAVSAAGGLGQAALERSRSMVFHRVAATSTGLHAARFAARGFSGSRHVLDGPRGAFSILGGGATTSGSSTLGELDLAPSGISVRIFPVNGFVQAVVALAAAAGVQARNLGGRRASDDGRSDSHLEIEVGITAGVIPAVSGEHGGDWWDIRSAVASAYLSGDPFDLALSPDARALRHRVIVRAAELPVGYGQLRIGAVARMSAAPVDDAPREDASSAVTPPPGLDIGSEATRSLLATKWSRMLSDPGAPQRLVGEASALLSEGGDRVPQALVSSMRRDRTSDL